MDRKCLGEREMKVSRSQVRLLPPPSAYLHYSILAKIAI